MPILPIFIIPFLSTGIHELKTPGTHICVPYKFPSGSNSGSTVLLFTFDLLLLTYLWLATYLWITLEIRL
jgi:hypothetical protein